MSYKNAIIRYDVKPASAFTFNPLNPRLHPEPQRKAVQASLAEFGWVSPVIENETTGYLIDGHERIWDALAKGDNEPVPYIIVNVPAEKEPALLALFDKITTMATYDADMVNTLLSQIDFDSLDADLQNVLQGLEDDIVILDDLLEEKDRDPSEPSDQLRDLWKTETGQLWIIPTKYGEHRLLCGDSTNPDHVARVMGGNVSQLVVTDPPYGVSYSEKNAFLNSFDKGDRIESDIVNDGLSKEDSQKLWGAVFRNTASIMDDGAVIYCFMPQGGDQMMMMMMMMMNEGGIEPRHELIWLKNNHVLGRTDYAYKHEPILYAWKKGGHKFYGDFQTSILEFDKPLKSDLHPTMKPVPLIRRLIENSSQRREIVFDPFGGSGTTMVACEESGRQCRMIELEPKYVAVILQRLTDMGRESYLHDTL